MRLTGSVVVAFDGESKCGKTTIINAVAGEAEFQASIIPSLVEGNTPTAVPLSDECRLALQGVQDHLGFRSVTKISAGNAYRAAALYAMEEEEAGRGKESFVPDDVERVRALLARENIEDRLQNDDAIGKQVSSVAALAGAQALCGTIFCDAIHSAYMRDGGANLVVVDARDPIGHMRRNQLLGSGPDLIAPSSIVPIYIDTPAEVAAARMAGNFEDNLALVRQRRHIDATRTELPVTRPHVMIDDLGAWLRQFDPSTDNEAIAHPYRFDNGAHVELDHVQYVAGMIASVSHDIACLDGRPVQL